MQEDKSPEHASESDAEMSDPSDVPQPIVETAEFRALIELERELFDEPDAGEE